MAAGPPAFVTSDFLNTISLSLVRVAISSASQVGPHQASMYFSPRQRAVATALPKCRYVQEAENNKEQPDGRK